MAADFARASGRRAAAGRYRAFVPAAIAETSFDLDASTHALAERAASRVAELNRSSGDLVSLEGLARQLLRSEALASSQIEGLNLSHRKLAQAALDQGTHKANEVLGNLLAMEEAVQVGAHADPITAGDVEQIHRTLAIAPPLDRFAGEFRTGQGWIGGTTPADAEYVGPPHPHVRRLVEDVCAFMSRDDVPVVVQAAIAHAQFELIHPFADGNGRTGRCLIHAMLRRRNIAPRYVPPVSLVLGANKDAYIAGITAYRHNQVEAWVEHFARAVERAAQGAERFSAQIREQQQRWTEQAEPLRSDAVARQIIDLLPSFPFITVKVVMERTGKSNVAANNGLKRLTEAGILTAHENRRKGNSWEAKDLFDLLDDFERSLRT